MEIKPKLSVTGYRAIWGTDLTEQIAFEYSRAYAKYCKSKGAQKILIGRDARQSGPIILSSVIKAFLAEGMQVEYAGILPTPTMLLLVKKLNFDAGVMITASHNPIEYNGIKFIVHGGRLTNAEETKAIQDFYDSLSNEEKIVQGRTLDEPTIDSASMRRIHIDEILKNLDGDLIRNKNFKVALDPINSGGSLITQELLKELNCEVQVINDKMTGLFAHRPEPLPENLSETAEFVENAGVDIGFVQDPDADRLIVINEKGEIIGEEKTLVLAIKNVLAKEPGDIVINLSTSSMSEEVAKEYGRKTYRTKIGEANVVQKILEVNAPIGGEGSSGAIYPKINTARDSLVGIGLILELMARENKKISEISDSLPKFYMHKENIHFVGDLGTLYPKLKTTFPNVPTNEEDGIRFDFPDQSWIHVRPSNTEPLVRIFGEGKTPEAIKKLVDQVNLTLNSN
jgi:phosphomannomutase